MSARTYGILMKLIAFALAAIVAMSVIVRSPIYIPLIALMIAMLAMSLSRRFVKEITTDERNTRIFEKATALSYRIYSIVTAISALLAYMFRSSQLPWLSVAGETLAYSLCGFMLIHLVIINYYQKKL